MNRRRLLLAGSVYSAADGSFAFNHLPAGRYDLEVWEDAIATSRDYPREALATLTLAPGQVVEDFTITLPDEKGELAGVVLDPAGRPAEDVLVTYRVTYWSSVDDHFAPGERLQVTGADGRFTFLSLPSTYRYRIDAFRADGARASADTPPAGSAPRIMLRLR